MELTPFENTLKKIACLLGIVEGCAYGTLALICIILYNREYLELNPTTYFEIINFYMYNLFLGVDARSFPDQVLYPKIFSIFVWVYFILSLIWIGVSIEAFFKKGVVMPRFLTAWSHLTLLISVWDFITVVILGVDYNRCLPAFASPFLVDYQSVCANGILPVLTIAARGFILWIVNVIFAVTLNQMALKLKKEIRSQVQHLQQQPQMQPTSPVPVYPNQPQMSGYPIQQPVASYGPAAPYVPPPKGHYDNPYIPDPDYQYYQQNPTRRF